MDTRLTDVGCGPRCLLHPFWRFPALLPCVMGFRCTSTTFWNLFGTNFFRMKKAVDWGTIRSHRAQVTKAHRHINFSPPTLGFVMHDVGSSNFPTFVSRGRKLPHRRVYGIFSSQIVGPEFGNYGGGIGLIEGLK